MSTIPFVQVEGSIALPRMRPLDRIPPPFGREWRFVPPHFSLHAEIKALYAAIMRTVCLSAEAFRAAWRWDQHRRMLAEPAAALVAESAYAGASGPSAAAAHVPAGPSRSSLPRANAARTARRARSGRMPALARHRLAGGACAIGGAALLTWILASQAPHADKQPTGPALAHPGRDIGNTGGNADDNAISQRLADERAAHERTLAAPPAVSNDQPAQTAPATTSYRATSAPAAHASANRPDFSAAANAQTAQRVTLAPSIPGGEIRADQSSTTARTQASRAQAGREANSEPNRAARAVKGHKGLHVARTFAPNRVEPRDITRRTKGMYSGAGHYSPRQPSRNHDDDYASIVAYANTYTAPRPTGRAPIPADSTDWVNHVSQRRVTDVPDRFEK